MIKSIKHLFIAMFIYVVPLMAQHKPLSVGDDLPDILVNNVHNYSKTTLSNEDLKGKLIILDFWATSCSSCLAAFPKLEQLQKTFDSSIQIILVNSYENDSQVNERIANIKNRKPNFSFPDLPFINGDTLLRQLFPHQLIPHHVWINQHGRIIAIANGYNATEENIKKALSESHLDLHEKKDMILNGFDPRKDGIFRLGNQEIKGYYSGLTHFIPGVGSGNGRKRDTLNHTFRRTFLNSTVQRLYEDAFRSLVKEDRMLIETKDRTPFQRPEDPNFLDSWYNQYLFSYEILVPIAEEDKIQEIMRKDINRFFETNLQISAVIEKRAMPSLILTTKQHHLLKPYEADSKQSYKKDGTTHTWTNYRFSNFVNSLGGHIEDLTIPLALVDETGMGNEYCIDIKISDSDLNDIPKLTRILNQFGLDIIAAEREIEVLVIKDLNR